MELDMRKYNRRKYSVEMTISSMYKQDYDVIDNVDAVIDLFDISRGGLGFYCTSDLPTDYYFNVNIVFDGEHYFKAVVKIVRKNKLDDKYAYGCVFVGLAENLALMIDECLI